MPFFGVLFGHHVGALWGALLGALLGSLLGTLLGTLLGILLGILLGMFFGPLLTAFRLRLRPHGPGPQAQKGLRIQEKVPQASEGYCSLELLLKPLLLLTSQMATLGLTQRLRVTVHAGWGPGAPGGPRGSHGASWGPHGAPWAPKNII